MATSRSSKHHINLALQGGGSHGAFTWGVLDYFLSLDEIEIEGISGTSAGAMNAVILAEAMEEKGASYAREALELFWKEVSKAGQFSPFNYSPIDRMNGRWDLENSPAFVCFDWWSRLVSPYQFNPLNINPLQAILEKFVDFNHLKKCSKTQLFVSATNVRTGKVRVFENHELSSQVLLASACLPFLFQSVEVEGEYYWDGGYSGNPVLFPLLNNCHSRDVMIVQINPIERKKVPTTAREIINRMQEISFNASLIQEVHTIHLLNCLLLKQDLPQRYRQILLHSIESDTSLSDLGASSKFNTDWTFLSTLKKLGYDAAEQWMNVNGESLGKESTLDAVNQFCPSFIGFEPYSEVQ